MKSKLNQVFMNKKCEEWLNVGCVYAGLVKFGINCEFKKYKLIV